MKKLHSLHTQVSGRKFDFFLLGTIITLTVFGLIMVYDASIVQAEQDFGDKFYLIKQQLIWVLLGFLSLGFFAFYNYRFLQKMALPIFIGALLLLILVMIPGLGVAAGGAHRWLRLGFFTLQPAEIIKLATVIFFAALFQKDIRLGPFGIVVGVVLTIIAVFQRDLGSALVFLSLALGMFYVAGANLRYFLTIIPVGLLAILGFIMTSSYRKQRVLAFFDPFADPQGYSYHISQVLIALGSGGFWGVGIGQSRQKLAYIPEVTTDSIFSIIGEEFGFIGGILLIALFVVLIQRGFAIAASAPDSYSKLLAAGITIWLAAQVTINLAAMVSLIPLTGVPLPFISYGGSALLCNLAAMGILLNISHSVRA